MAKKSKENNDRNQKIKQDRIEKHLQEKEEEWNKQKKEEQKDTHDKEKQDNDFFSDNNFEEIKKRAKSFSKTNLYEQYEKEQFGSLFFSENDYDPKNRHLEQSNRYNQQENSSKIAKIQRITKDIVSISEKDKENEENTTPKQPNMNEQNEQDKTILEENSPSNLKKLFDLKEFGMFYENENRNNNDNNEKQSELKDQKGKRKKKIENEPFMVDFNEFPNILEIEKEIIERYKLEIEQLPPFTIFTTFNDWYSNVYLNLNFPEPAHQTYEEKNENTLKKQYKEYLTKKLEETKAYIEQLKQLIANTIKEQQKFKGFIKKMNEFPKMIGQILEYYESTNRLHVKLSNNNKIIIEYSRPKSNLKLEPGTRISLMDRTFDVNEILKNEIDSFVSGMEIQSGSIDLGFEDVGGLEEQIQELREAVEYPITKPHIFERIGIEPPKGVLLYGPPGSGKTLLAKAVAASANATFIRLVGSELVQMYIGEGARLVRELFKLARQKAPSIIFIDEIDAIGRMRSGDGQSSENEIYRTLLTLLAEIDGFDSTSNIRFIAATNMMELLDPALMRPGRFDRKIFIPPPDKQGREAIFKILSKKLKLESQTAYQKLIDLTEGLTGADIKNIIMEAGMFAIRENAECVTERHFMAAYNKLKESSFRINPAISKIAYS